MENPTKPHAESLENGLFVFHRDYRLTDNTGLIQATSRCRRLYCCFIFTPDQVAKNSYRSDHSIQFMIESLEDLQQDIIKHHGELLFFYGNHVSILSQIIEKLNIQGVFFNDDYTPYAIQRTLKTTKLCEQKKIDCQSFSDYYLFSPGTILNGQGESYKKFTPFYDSAMTQLGSIQPVVHKQSFPFSKTTIPLPHKITLENAKSHFYEENPELLVNGGRTHGIKRLHSALQNQGHYDRDRDNLTYETTFLSAYIKFGCVSIREVYFSFAKKYGKKCGLIRELMWREFFASILFHFPEVVGQSYQPKYKHIQWSHSTAHFEKWKKGMTGFPIVDAGMRQMNATGYMHNRVRMMTASFLVKTLLLDWRWGEKYFAQRLTDYDIASNNGNWQGISGTGVDMKPYFRDMNPFIQSKKFDKEAEYIQKWVPELKEVLPKDIHKWDIMCNDEKYKQIDYPAPILDYGEQKQKMLALYK